MGNHENGGSGVVGVIIIGSIDYGCYDKRVRNGMNYAWKKDRNTGVIEDE